MGSMFAERLKLVRKQKGLTQEDIANAIGSNKSTISQYESGARRPAYEQIIVISEYLGVSADYMLGLTDDPNGKLTQSSSDVQYHKLIGIIRDYFINDNIEQAEKDNLFKEISSLYWKYKK